MLKKIILMFCALFFGGNVGNTGSSGAFAWDSAEHYDSQAAVVADIEKVIAEALEAFDVPGLAVGVVVDDRVILLQGYGQRSREENLPVTKQTLFPIGSCTKAFTTTLLGQLVDEGRIRWDDPVVNHIPEFRLANEEITTQVTIRDLVAHRVGLPRHDALWLFKEMPRSQVLPSLQHLELVHGLGEKWLYNNLLYSAAGIVIERVTGQSWEEAIHERIFLPLGMSQSAVGLDQSRKRVNLCTPYATLDGAIQKIPFHPLHGVEPAGAISSNVVEMLQWVQALLLPTKSLVTGNTREEMQSVQISFEPNERENTGISQRGYGLGWFVGDYADHKVISHGGLVRGFSAEVSLLPNERIGIIILTNSSTDGFYATSLIRNTILDKLLGMSGSNWIDLTKAKREQAKESSPADQQLEHMACPHSLHDYAGSFEHPAYGRVQIHANTDQLVVSYGTITLRLDYLHDETFTGQIVQSKVYGFMYDAEVTFVRDASGVQEVHIPLDAVAKPIVFKRVTPLYGAASTSL